MFASVTTAQFRPNALKKLPALYHQLVPILKTVPGWCGVYVLANRQTGYSQLISLWETEAAAVQFQTSGMFQRLGATVFNGLTVGPPQRELYAVVFQAHEVGVLSAG
jgi:heme-degrading monooxygenase HmoA